MIRALQERAARALPARYVEDARGWWLRHAPGCGWWVGSVLPHGGGDLSRRIDGAERFYARYGTVTRFQISPGACPSTLDGLLADRGYHRESPVSLRVAQTAHVLPDGRNVDVDDRPTPAWFNVWYAVHGGDPRAERELLDRVPQPAGYARAMVDGAVVAVGRVVADTGWAGVFGMATLPGARGKGAGRAVLAALARWAAVNHADRMYLQVEQANTAALRLYERAGFAEVCGYHYRVRAGTGTPSRVR
jgi:ribosomal protein S18 acetylase RimI-like enzyme